MSKLNTLVEEMKAVQEKMKSQGEAAVKEALTEFLAAHPAVESLRWTQYAPYFNDGDPCVFHYKGLHFKITDGDNEDDEDGYQDGTWEMKDSPLKAAIEDLDSKLKDCEDILEVVFGENARVTVGRDGIEVEEYEHD